MELAPLKSAADGRRGGGGSDGRLPRPSGLPALAGLPLPGRCSCTADSCADCCRLAAPLLSVVVVLALEAGSNARAWKGDRAATLLPLPPLGRPAAGPASAGSTWACAGPCCCSGEAGEPPPSPRASPCPGIWQGSLVPLQWPAGRSKGLCRPGAACGPTECARPKAERFQGSGHCTEHWQCDQSRANKEEPKGATC